MNVILDNGIKRIDFHCPVSKRNGKTFYLLCHLFFCPIQLCLLQGLHLGKSSSRMMQTHRTRLSCPQLRTQQYHFGRQQPIQTFRFFLHGFQPFLLHLLQSWNFLQHFPVRYNLSLSRLPVGKKSKHQWDSRYQIRINHVVPKPILYLLPSHLKQLYLLAQSGQFSFQFFFPAEFLLFFRLCVQPLFLLLGYLHIQLFRFIQLGSQFGKIFLPSRLCLLCSFQFLLCFREEYSSLPDLFLTFRQHFPVCIQLSRSSDCLHKDITDFLRLFHTRQ